MIASEAAVMMVDWAFMGIKVTSPNVPCGHILSLRISYSIGSPASFHSEMSAWVDRQADEQGVSIADCDGNHDGNGIRHVAVFLDSDGDAVFIGA